MFVIFDLFKSSRTHILISLGSYAPTCILASSYRHVRVYFLVYLHPHILISPGLCALVGILTSSDPQIYVCLLVCSHLQVSVFSILINKCLLASSGSLVLSNCASQFVNNLQILPTRQAFVLNFYHTRKKICQK